MNTQSTPKMHPADSGAKSVNSDGVISRSPKPAQPAHLSVMVAWTVTPLSVR